MRRLRIGLMGLVAATLLACLAAEARADMCFGGGGAPREPQQDSGSVDDGAVGENLKSKRRVGMGLLAVASVGTAWLSFRRRSPGGE